MAMIKCPECGTEVSDKAEKCLKCAYPISNQLNKEKIQVIEQTSKDLKKQMIYAVLVVIFGIIVMIPTAIKGSTGGAFFGVLLTLFGLIWIFVVKTKIWWHHK